MSATYQYYWDKLAGRSPLAIVDQPQFGFYRNTRKEPVAFFPVVSASGVPTGSLSGVKVLKGGRIKHLSLEQSMEEWTFCCGDPRPEKEWRAVAEEGGHWSDEAPGIGHNQPPEDGQYTPPSDRAPRLVQLALKWLADNDEVVTRAQADQAAHYIKGLVRVASDLEDERKEAERPYKGFIDQVKLKYRELRTPPLTAIEQLKARVKPFMQALADAADREERERAAVARAEAMASSQRHAQGDKAKSLARVGGRGNAVTLRVRYWATVTDHAAALAAVADDYRVKEVVQTIANERARSVGSKKPGAELLPGTTLEKEDTL